MKVTGQQIRAARAFLDWTIADLTKAAGISETTIRNIEKAAPEAAHKDGVASTREWRAQQRSETVAKIAEALHAAGITFLPETAAGPGVRCKPTPQ